MKIDLGDLNILVTGASRGIGAAIARQLGESGAHVAIHYHQNRECAEKVMDSIGRKATLFQANLAEPFEVIKLFKEVVEHYGHLDVIVNNAGMAISMSDMEEDVAWLDNWVKTVDVNLNAVGLLCKKAVQHFKETGKGGRIINITSRAAFRGDTSNYIAYAASKGGVVALTRSIARAYGKDEIKAFNIAPGFTKTDMAKDFIEQYGEEHASSDLALNRMTEPSDIAPMVAMLASGLADHATGCTIDINAASYVH